MSTELFSLAMNEISDCYIEEALTYQAHAKHYRAKSMLRIALVACLAVIMVLSTALVASAELREIVFGWIKEQYETFTHYKYREEEVTGEPAADISEIFVPHYLTEVPPGYTEINDICDEEVGMQLVIYRNEDNGQQFLFSASCIGDAFVEEEGYTIQPVDVAGVAGELYIPDDPTKDSCIVWMSENMFCYISGYFTPEEMVYYAECLQPITEPEDAEDTQEPIHSREYRFDCVPEGYNVLAENHGPHDNTIIYINEAGLTISFAYIHDPDGAEMIIKHKDHVQKTVTINGEDAELQVSNDLAKDSSCISWAENDILFYISAFLPEEDLIALAESVEEIPVTELEEES